MYNDHKTARDRVTSSKPARELSTRTMWVLATVAIFCLLMAGRADFAAVQAGLI